MRTKTKQVFLEFLHHLHSSLNQTSLTLAGPQTFLWIKYIYVYNFLRPWFTFYCLRPDLFELQCSRL